MNHQEAARHLALDKDNQWLYSNIKDMTESFIMSETEKKKILEFTYQSRVMGQVFFHDVIGENKPPSSCISVIHRNKSIRACKQRLRRDVGKETMVTDTVRTHLEVKSTV